VRSLSECTGLASTGPRELAKVSCGRVETCVTGGATRTRPVAPKPAAAFVRSPKQNANGARNQFYQNMRQVSPGASMAKLWRNRLEGKPNNEALPSVLSEQASGPGFDCLVHIGQNKHMKPQIAKADPESASSAVRPRRRPVRVATFRNSRGETLEPSSVSASEAKSEFGRVLEMAVQGGAVVITKHGAPKAVLISVDNFNALSGAAHTKLDTLSREFDALLARMQTSKTRRGMKAAFAASGRRLGKAAVAAARSRG
jgi:antitoxin Phd